MTNSARAALLAGVGLAVMTVVAPIANFGLIQGLVVAGDPSATARNIASSSGTFRLGIAGLVLVAVVDVIVALALYVYLKPASQRLSLLAALLRVVYAGMFGVAINELVTVAQLAGTAGSANAVMMHVEAFQSRWDLALGLFGVHLVVLGALIFRARPRYLGILVVVSGLGYLVDGVGKALSSSYSLDVALFTFFGEVVLMFWLLIKGWRVSVPLSRTPTR